MHRAGDFKKGEMKMKNKISSIILVGILFITIPSTSVSCDAEYVIDEYKNEVDITPITGQWFFLIAIGNFDLEDGLVSGHASIVFILDGSNYIPIPMMLFDATIDDEPLDDGNPNTLDKVIFTKHVLIGFLIWL